MKEFQIWIDADACPVVRQVEEIAKEYDIDITLLCDTNHFLQSDYSQVVVIGAGTDAVDFALVSRCKKGDVVVTQDYGVAAMVLGKGAHPIHQSGRWYTNDNMDQLLLERHLSQKARRSNSKYRGKGPKKRTSEDNDAFKESFVRLLQELLKKE